MATTFPVTDNFTGYPWDGAYLDASYNWISPAGTSTTPERSIIARTAGYAQPEFISGQVFRYSSAARIETDWPTAQYSQFVPRTYNVTQEPYGPCVRMSNVSTSPVCGYIFAMITYQNYTNYPPSYISKRSGATITQLASCQTYPRAFNNFPMRIKVVGTQITAYNNGEEAGSVIDGTYETGVPGFMMGSLYNSFSIMNFEAGIVSIPYAQISSHGKKFYVL